MGQCSRDLAESRDQSLLPCRQPQSVSLCFGRRFDWLLCCASLAGNISQRGRKASVIPAREVLCIGCGACQFFFLFLSVLCILCIGGGSCQSSVVSVPRIRIRGTEKTELCKGGGSYQKFYFLCSTYCLHRRRFLSKVIFSVALV